MIISHNSMYKIQLIFIILLKSRNGDIIIILQDT